MVIDVYLYLFDAPIRRPWFRAGDTETNPGKSTLDTANKKTSRRRFYGHMSP